MRTHVQCWFGCKIKYNRPLSTGANFVLLLVSVPAATSHKPSVDLAAVLLHLPAHSLLFRCLRCPGSRVSRAPPPLRLLSRRASPVDSASLGGAAHGSARHEPPQCGRVPVAFLSAAYNAWVPSPELAAPVYEFLRVAETEPESSLAPPVWSNAPDRATLVRKRLARSVWLTGSLQPR